MTSKSKDVIEILYFSLDIRVFYFFKGGLKRILTILETQLSCLPVELKTKLIGGATGIAEQS